MSQPFVERAAGNNADLYEAVCVAHDIPVVRTESVLKLLAPPPPYFSDLVTLAPGVSVEVEATKPGGFKDGFYDIDASVFGYQLLFEASWIWYEGSPTHEAKLRWEAAQSESELDEWHDRWWGLHAAERTSIYLPGMVYDPALRFLTAYQDDVPIGCGLLNRSQDVVGISNLFAFEAGNELIWADIATIAASHFPGMPFCGYERDDALNHALANGFNSVGKLRVWIQ